MKSKTIISLLCLSASAFAAPQALTLQASTPSAMTPQVATPANTQAYKQRMAQKVNASLRRQIAKLKTTPQERECLEFLYAYLPAADLADYSPEFWLKNVRASLQARSEMPWGNEVPMREWKHFVLPVRVNNEALDMARPQFYDEIKHRVKGMSLRDAILEVNHWCHEKVTYKPSDARTSSPLSALSQAIGRCGEESTFAVAALRSVGIPARQVYTPRWAHTDDNHAWVEVWADGKWWFIGACEPEPVLNLAWFNAPASRGMLMNTNVFGQYDGPEEVLSRTPLITTINVTSNYAKTHEARVRVLNADGSAAEGARVAFSLYNYAEYFPVGVKYADADGVATLKSGIGDMIVWASDKDGRFNFTKVDGNSDGVVDIVLSKDKGYSGVTEFDIVPPRGDAALPAVTAEMRAENDRRFAYEDSVRMAYVATFATPQSAAALAAECGVCPDRLTPLMLKSRGNHAVLAKVLRDAKPQDRELILRLLEAVTEKDLRDIPVEAIGDAVEGYKAVAAATPTEQDYQYVLSPRIEMELLRPERVALAKKVNKTILGGKCKSKKLTEAQKIDKLTAWIDGNVRVDALGGSYRTSPTQVMERRVCNARSREIYFVAAARALGVQARIDGVTGKLQWRPAGSGADTPWHDVSFASDADGGDSQSAVSATGTLKLDFTPSQYIVDPKYFNSFTISSINNGVISLLDYPEDASWSNTFAEGVALDAGQYILTTGQRLADGSVLARSEIFSIAPGQQMVKPLSIRTSEGALSVIGNVNAENLYTHLEQSCEGNMQEGDVSSLLATAGRGFYVIACLQPNHEPSAHLINDIALAGAELAATGRQLILLFADSESAARFRRDLFPELPANVHFGIDNNGVTRKEIEASLHMEGAQNPLVVVADSFNRIVFASTGYNIGLGERLLQTLRQVSK